MMQLTKYALISKALNYYHKTLTSIRH